MTPHLHLFTNIEPYTAPVVTEDGKRILATGRGTVILRTRLKDRRQRRSRRAVLVRRSPRPRVGIQSGFSLPAEPGSSTSRVFGEPRGDDIGLIPPQLPSQRAVVLAVPASQAFLISAIQEPDVSAHLVHDEEERSGAPDGVELAPPLSDDQRHHAQRLWSMWHQRIGQGGDWQFPILARNSVGLPAVLSKRSTLRLLSCRCETCSLTNIKRPPFPTSTTKTTRALELVHADLTGRIITCSIGGAEYLAVLVDDYTRMVWCLPLVRKSDFASQFAIWRDEQVALEGPICCLRTDGGGEFNSAAVRTALGGARHEMSCAYTSQQNGVAERHVGIIKNIMRPLIHGRTLPLEYWAEAASTAAYIRNRWPNTALDGKTPFEMWTGTKPNLTELRIFGCVAYAMYSEGEGGRHGLAERAKAGVFIGYDKYHKGYRVHFPDTGKVIVTRDADFHEEAAYDFASLSTSTTTTQAANSNQDRLTGGRPQLVVIGPRPPAGPAPAPTVEVNFDPETILESSPSVGAAPQPAAAQPAPPAPPEPAVAAPRAPQVIPPPPAQSFARNTLALLDHSTLCTSRHSSMPADKRRAETIDEQMRSYGVELEPETLKEAMRRPDWAKWLEAMKEEMQSHADMGTWVLAELPADRELVGCRWVFKLKLDSKGNVVRFKARL